VSVASVLRLSSTIFSALVALCFLNRPRFWWQEAICNFSPYFVPLLAVALIRNVKGLKHGYVTRLVSLLGMLASAYCLYTIISLAVPFFWYPRWSKTLPASADTLRLVFIDDCYLSQSDAREILLIRNPEVAVVVGAARESLLLEGTTLNNRRDFGDADKVSILSSLDLPDRGVPNLGFSARPGGVVGVKLASGATVDLGVIGLRPSTTQSEFERNRISARRLSSYMRNSDATRLVIGSFYATPFSQFASVFTSQARLRSLWYGKGMVKTFDMNHTLSYFTFSHGFISRDMRPLRVERLSVPGCARAGLFADLRIESRAGSDSHASPHESTIEDIE